MKSLKRLIFVISVVKLVFVDFNSYVIASPKIDHDNNIKFILSNQDDEMKEKSRLDQSLEIINKMDNSKDKIILLNDLAINYLQLGNQEMAKTILDESLSIAESFEDVTVKVTMMTNIAKFYAEINQKTKALEILDDTVEIASRIEDKSLQGQLLFKISLKYGEMGEEELAQKLLIQSQTIVVEKREPLTQFPFTETPSEFKLGFSGYFKSFRDTTGAFGVNFDFSKQWSEDDIFVDASFYLDYDSSRSVNNYRPSSLITTVYRYHFNSEWNFFTDFFNTTNQDLYSSKNDDEDLVISSMIFVGAGLNLWRGESPSNFLDLQLGIGPRYEYDYIDFEQRRNQIDPAFALIFLGRGIPIGEAQLHQTFGIISALNNFDNYIISSDSKLSIPLGEKWSLTNRLFALYRNELVFEDNPKVEVFFSVGLEYEF